MMHCSDGIDVLFLEGSHSIVFRTGFNYIITITDVVTVISVLYSCILL